ncbi:hypothetical protein GL50803_009283 [Giardia duodenalis]|uniref:Uncharacterized protein n=1 Tax=Giardia intestinalis (strain ATCC 50803 / WB clone C6) TaxID=184922 RepID=A8BBR4_GIAIC|nr:hypothetical protein GL50803_009283 [Giardia intestinalis]KAE8305252.1 hypothetical protein GL50803_009283 [Giardia intestinalis]|eukprot:XP_001708044.1 Hypothetical protein GL50803_9283 [Giardia lamblia ATCC 50803]
MARLAVINSRLSQEYSRYEALWKEYERVSTEFHNVELGLQSGPSDSFDERFSDLYSEFSSLIYKIEHMHNLLERLMTEVDREERELAAHEARLKESKRAMGDLVTTGSHSHKDRKDLTSMPEHDAVVPGGLSLRSIAKSNIISSQGQSYGPMTRDSTAAAKQAHREFLDKYGARLSKAREIQQLYDKAILEAEQKRENAFAHLMETIKKINSEHSIRVQRRLDEEDKRTAQRLKEITAFHEQIAANIEHGIVTTDNVYKKFREEDQKRLLATYIKARKKQLLLSKKAAEEFATEMARRELQYYKDCEATKRQKTIKAKSISSVNRSAETITRVTGLDDPCEVLYQSTRSKHLRDPVSVVAKNIVPPSVGLGLRTRSGGLEPDISHHEAYKAEEQRLISTSAILAASKNKSSPSRADPMSYLCKDPFYDMLPKNTTPANTTTQVAADLQEATRTSSKEQRRPSPTQVPARGKGADAKKEVREIDFDAWPSSDDDNEVALAYDHAPPPPPESFSTTKRDKTNTQKLPVAKPIVSSQASERLGAKKLASSHLRKLKTLDMPCAIQTQTVMSSHLSSSSAFLCHPSAVIFFDYAPGQSKSFVIQVTNVSAGLAAFKVLEPEPQVLHLLKFTYTPSGFMASGAKTSVTIIFTPPLNEKACLTVIDTSLTIKYQTGELHVPITCYPRQIAILILKNLELVRKVYEISISLRNSSPETLATKATLIHTNINGAIISDLGATLSQTMNLSSLALNKDGGRELITLATPPHGVSQEAFYLSNSGALPALVRIRLDACALHSSLLGIPVPQTILTGSLTEIQQIANDNVKAHSTSRPFSMEKQLSEQMHLTFDAQSSSPSTLRGSMSRRKGMLLDRTIPQTFRSTSVSIDTVYSYMQQATRSTSPRIPSKLYSTDEVETRHREVEAYVSALNKRVEEILASNTPAEVNPPAAKSLVARQRSPKAGLIQQKQTHSTDNDTTVVPNITRDDAIDVAITELGPQPEELSTELMVEALSNISVTGHNESARTAPLLQIGTPFLAFYEGKAFHFEPYFARLKKEKLKDILSENLQAITAQLEDERRAYEKSLEQPVALQKGNGGTANSSTNKGGGRPPSTRGTKDVLTTNDQQSSKEDTASNTLLDPVFFKSELDRRVKEKTETDMTAWAQAYNVANDLLEYTVHSNIELSIVLPPMSIVALPVVHSPLRFLLDMILKLNLTVKPIFPCLDKSDDDYAVLQSSGEFTNTLLVNAYTLQSGVYALSSSIDYLTCFYNSTYSSEIRLRSVDNNSRPITVFVPTLMKTICSSNVSETIICKTTGDLHIKVSLLCESKAELMRILNQVEQYQELVDYTDLEYTIKENRRPPATKCPLESWADIFISGVDQYAPTLPSVVLGDDVRALNEQLKQQLQELDSLLNYQQELETKLATLLQKKQAVEDALRDADDSKPSSTLGSGRAKELAKAVEKKTPSKSKTTSSTSSQEEFQRLTLECDQLSSNLQTIRDQDLPLLQGRVANAKAELRNLSSVGGYISCSFNILIRVSGQPEPILVRLSTCFTSSELLVKLPYTHPSASEESASIRAKSSVLSQVTKTVRTMRTVGTLATRANRTLTEGYLTINDTLDLQDRSSVNLGEIALWHVTNVPVIVRNSSALPQHVALLTKPVPDVSLLAGPDNGTILLYPGQEVRMHLGILPNNAKKFQVKCSIESEFGYIKNFTICATSMQPSLLCQSSMDIFRMSVTDILRVEQIYLRSTVNMPKKWSISPAFLQFMETNFNGFLSIKPTAGVVAAQSIYRMSVTINTSASLLVRLLSFLDDQHADEALKDLLDLSQTSRPISATAVSPSHNALETYTAEPSPNTSAVLGTSSTTDIINYLTKKNQFLYIQRRHLDPSVLLPDNSSILSDSDVSVENDPTTTDLVNTEEGKQKKLDSNEMVQSKKQIFVDQHLTINIPIMTEDAASPFLVCPLNLLIARPIIVIAPVPNRLCDELDVAPDDAILIPPLTFKEDLNSTEGTTSSALLTANGGSLQVVTQGIPEDPITKQMPALAESKYVANLLRQEALKLPTILAHNQSLITLNFGYVPLGCVSNRSAVISLNESLPFYDREQYYGDHFQFRRQLEEAFDSDIILTSCLEEASMTAQKPLTLHFEYSPRRVGYTEETIELSSSSLLTSQRLNNVILKLKGYGVKVTLAVTLDSSSSLVQTDFPLPDIYTASQSDVIYTESPPILIVDTSETYTHLIALTLSNENKYDFKYNVKYHECSENISQTAIASEGVVPKGSSIMTKILIGVFGVTEANGSLAVTEIVSGDAKKLVICRCFASRHPVSMYFIGPVVTVPLQGSTKIYCGCAIEQPQAEFKHISTSPQLLDLVISPASGTVQAGKMAKMTLSVPKLAFSGALSLTMEGYISFKLTCGSFEKTAILPVRITLN